MKRTILLVLLVGLCCAGCEESKRREVVTAKREASPPSCPTTRPIGVLGVPLGTYVKIEGHTYEATKPPRRKGPARTLLVDTVQGKTLHSPIKLVIENVDIDSLQTEVRCVLNGYESGAWVGSPEGLPPGTPVAQTKFTFFNYFVVTSVEAPKGLEVKR